MNRDQLAHPDDEELLLYLDGEVDGSAAEATRRHLDSCWTCRMRASNIQAAIIEYARERERSGVPNPPAPWRDLNSDFQRVHDSVRAPSLLRRIGMGSLFRNGRVPMFAGVASAIAAVSWFFLPREVEKDAREPATVISASPNVNASVPAPVVRPAAAPIERTQPRTTPPEKFVGTAHEELAIIAELHRVRADLGEPIDLGRTGDGQLVLNAADLGPDRADEIRRAMVKFPDLKLRFSEPTVSNVAHTGAAVPVARRPIAFEEQLLHYSGSRTYLEKLANSVLDASDQIAMYAQALQKIDNRFSRSALDDEDRTVLDRIRRDYQSGARDALKSLRNLMDPLFETLGIEPTTTSRGDFLKTALQTDQLLNATFAGAQNDLDDRELYSELRGATIRLAELLQ
jgi:hypothetical protein